ncbi:MAG: flavin reductase [Bacteroidales bacterium]|nr:flavin reductase [Bacteroidales bacterium]
MDLTKIAKHDIFKLISKDWMLITAGNQEKFNTMTASWGGFGYIWNRPVAFIFIRESRYTRGFVENGERLTLSFYDEKYRKALQICGSKSGRDIDKVKEAGLTPKFLNNNTVTFAEAHTTVSCRKLFSSTMEENQFADSEIFNQFYVKAPGGKHIMYIVEIEEVE